MQPAIRSLSLLGGTTLSGRQDLVHTLKDREAGEVNLVHGGAVEGMNVACRFSRLCTGAVRLTVAPDFGDKLEAAAIVGTLCTAALRLTVAHAAGPDTQRQHLPPAAGHATMATGQSIENIL
ncbi:MAG: hypothetical protein EDM73_11340 [Armatimonadetes bacterium]|nr:MAG: hypothetical protein EDM73_11340 [Armatimonadota bacterium]